MGCKLKEDLLMGTLGAYLMGLMALMRGGTSINAHLCQQYQSIFY